MNCSMIACSRWSKLFQWTLHSIRPLAAARLAGGTAIYLEGIATGNATFETAAPRMGAMGRRASARTAGSWLAAADDVLGFAALSPVSTRKVYAGVAEVSVYVSQQARGAGRGHLLSCAN